MEIKRCPMAKFNNGKPYHGSEFVENGGLRGATDTDYFYFFCPKCPNDQVVRILEYGLHGEQKTVNPYNDMCKSKAKGGFTLVFKIHCENCGHQDFVKISNLGRQTDKFTELLKTNQI